MVRCADRRKTAFPFSVCGMGRVARPEFDGRRYYETRPSELEVEQPGNSCVRTACVAAVARSRTHA